MHTIEIAGCDNNDDIKQKVIKICSSKDYLDVFLLDVFFIKEEEEEKKDNIIDNNILLIPFNSYDIYVNESKLDPTSYFNYKLMEYAEYFYDRHDLTYLLLNHFFLEY